MNEDTQTYHIPVLLNESVDGMNLHEKGIYVDVTFGGGGHSREILRRMDDGSRLFGFDQDEDAMQNAPEDKRFTFVRSNFRYLRNFLRYYGVEQADAILADLGVSSHHLDDASRGFSFRFDAPLDMRMNKRAKLTASDVVNTYDESSRRLASALVKARAQKPIALTGDLIDIVKPYCPKEREKKELAKIFQALRIEVNHEMDALKEMLQAAISVLKPGGRLAVITYHSLEDRMVKNMMKTGNIEGKVEQDFFGNFRAPLRAVGKPIVPNEDEIARNPRSRSAKLRIAEKVENG